MPRPKKPLLIRAVNNIPVMKTKMGSPNIGTPHRVILCLCQSLFNFDHGADRFQLLANLLGVFLAHAFLNRLGSAIDQILGFLQA